MPMLGAVYAAALKPYAGSFHAPELMTQAERATGLSDWGGERWAEQRFRARLDALCQGLEGEARLHQTGRSRAHSRLHVLLCSRLRQVDHHRRLDHDAAIAAPLVGTGLPRAGTTFLHGLLASDPDNRVATAAQAAIPVPPPGQAGANEAERTGLYESILAFQGFTAPDVTAIHPYAAAAPEECVFLQEAACGMPLGAFYHAPAFAALAGGPDAVADSYAWQKGMMESLQGDGARRRWLLKAPSHIIQTEALFAAFPDALVFINHRDPGKVIPSMASLYMKLYSLASDSSVDPLALGPRLVANWSGILDRLDAWREAHPEARIVDVHYVDLIADPIGTARRLYEAFGLGLSAATQSAMAAHLEADRHGKGPARRYALADFGLCEADIEEAFGAYIERHGVAREARA
ncbi:Sulfotransferase family protein [Novosphingobium sp. CF614]|uniref:sulfotransferase family protein n=1 Tax=Novosphingobium sp. CF614 TaxID=1884364 RepID=UPI0008DEFB37|nr:sulfotransferase [Novosphingobium sp. CF614]SFF96315.1 Sulfotransferase family protein [Novosphingobium sp. CF614]